MKIKSLYNENEINDITLDSYLSRCGIKNVESYKSAKSIESTTNYYNIDEFAKGMRWCLLSTDKFYLLVDS